MDELKGPQRIVTKEDATPGNDVLVELYEKNDDGEWETTNVEVSVRSTIYLDANHWGVVNDFTPSGGKPGRYLVAPGDPVS